MKRLNRPVNIRQYIRKLSVLVALIFLHAKCIGIEVNCFKTAKADLPEYELTTSRTSVSVACYENKIFVLNGGKKTQTIETPENASIYLVDVDGNNFLDLIIADKANGFNMPLWIWLFDIKKQKFDTPINLIGFDLFIDIKGYLVTSSRGSTESWMYKFYSLKKNKLTPKFEVSIFKKDDAVKCYATAAITKKPLEITGYINEHYCSHYSHLRKQPTNKSLLR